VELTINDLKELITGSQTKQQDSHMQSGLNGFIGKKVIVRTYSAGVWFGLLSEKSGNEVILENARRMYKWWAAESISLSAVALHGIKQDKSQIIEAVSSIWLEAIEICPCTQKAINDLEGAANVQAQ
jgi:hypothetical protein